MQEPMAEHTTFRAGGTADVFVTSELSCLRSVLQFLKKEKVPFVILGNGSNVLVSDKGYHGVIVRLSEGGANRADDRSTAANSDQNQDTNAGILIRENTLICNAGIKLGVAAHAAMEASLEGVAFAAGIPGTVGGALTMNAGAFGGEMKDIAESVTALDLEKDEVPEITLTREEMHFSYRHSIAAERKLCFTGATLKLMPGDRQGIETRMREISTQRTEKQPLNFPSAGSTFKRPEGYFAGKLIMDAGLRGYSVGGAQVSEKHCGFVINKGGATATDIYTLICDVQKTVLENSGVALEREVILLGDFD